MAKAEDRIVNTLTRGDTSGQQAAMAAMETLLQQGVREGVYKPDQTKQIRSELTRKVRQRMAPELLTPTQRRMEAVARQPGG